MCAIQIYMKIQQLVHMRHQTPSARSVQSVASFSTCIKAPSLSVDRTCPLREGMRAESLIHTVVQLQKCDLRNLPVEAAISAAQSQAIRSVRNDIDHTFIRFQVGQSTILGSDWLCPSSGSASLKVRSLNLK